MDISLFFGFPVDSAFDLALKSSNPQIIELFLKEGEGNYLREVSFQGKRFLGKLIGDKIDLEDLVLLESNIYSLLRKIAPDYHCQKVPLVLFPTPLS